MFMIKVTNSEGNIPKSVIDISHQWMQNLLLGN